MIKVNKMVPNVYYQHSRDFQFIGRLYEIALNSVKTNSELLYSLPNGKNADTSLLDLMSMTLGFKSLHNYNIDQLKSICSCLVEVIKSKGSIRAIEKACNALVSAEGITDSVYIDDTASKSELILYVSQDLSDVSLLRDLMDYILPAGLSYSIVKTLMISESINTTIKFNSNINSNISKILKSSSDVSVLDDTYIKEDITIPNITATPGLLINSTIIDTKTPKLIIVDSMEVQNETTVETITMNRLLGNFNFEIKNVGVSESAIFEVTCKKDYKIEGTTAQKDLSFWYKTASMSYGVKILQEEPTTGSPIYLSTEVDTGKRIYYFTLHNMVDENINITVKFSEGDPS